MVTALDEIAWTLNIRCNDVKHTPVATAYLYLRDGGGILFIDPAKLTPETTEYLASQGVVTEDMTKSRISSATCPTLRPCSLTRHSVGRP